jgi:hypothetical protein
MKLATVLAAVLVAGLTAPGFAGDKAKRPRLDARAAPRVVMSPARVLVVAQLVGGQDVEEYYCPGVEWDWGDGTRSFRESDCDPFEAGAELQRFFSESHVYRSPGNYNVRVSLTRAERTVAATTAHVLVGGYVAGLDN